MELEKICQSDYKGSSGSGKGEIDISAKASLVKEVEEEPSLGGRERASGRGGHSREGKGHEQSWSIGTREGAEEGQGDRRLTGWVLRGCRR